MPWDLKSSSKSRIFCMVAPRKALNTLRIVSYDAYISGAFFIIDQFANNGVLELIGILKLIYQHVGKALAVFIQHPLRIFLEYS
jgi:hypothetical protein